MKKIIPHLWFDTQAKEAAEFYISAFGDGKITQVNTLHDTPSGDAEVVAFEILGQPFMSISAGPYFKINPSISFSVNLETKEQVQTLWDKLSPGGQVLMELGSYPFSEFYGWVNDKYGVSWQLIALGEQAEGRPKITPALMFTQEHTGQAEEAIQFYTTLFKDSTIGEIFRYGAGQEPEKEGTVAHAIFHLEGQEFMALDSAQAHAFVFNEGVSLMVNCDNQEEIDYYWEKLSAVPEAEQCGWLKDAFGVSWQVVPSDLETKLATGTPEQQKRVTQAFLQMKKFDLAALEKAWNGEG